uniref:Uncharacterized protein n=1 Tax=Leersia perrieri TaxID=77586 RepID=A0A0D9XPX7_9ORYZ
MNVKSAEVIGPCRGAGLSLDDQGKRVHGGLGGGNCHGFNMCSADVDHHAMAIAASKACMHPVIS